MLDAQLHLPRPPNPQLSPELAHSGFEHVRLPRRPQFEMCQGEVCEIGEGGGVIPNYDIKHASAVDAVDAVEGWGGFGEIL